MVGNTHEYFKLGDKIIKLQNYSANFHEKDKKWPKMFYPHHPTTLKMVWTPKVTNFQNYTQHQTKLMPISAVKYNVKLDEKILNDTSERHKFMIS